jgi:lipid A disaccharide synthetase
MDLKFLLINNDNNKLKKKFQNKNKLKNKLLLLVGSRKNESKSR